MCGALGLSPWKFIAVDTIAAGFSVPTQVLLVAFYGEVIIQQLTRFKIYFFSAIAIGFAIFMIKKVLEKRRAARASSDLSSAEDSAKQLKSQ
jgi:membrane protein DedA with SNARE-associated domain